MIKEPKYKARFTSVARQLKPNQDNIAKASISNLKSLLPADYDQHPDLLPWAANVCVVNLANANGDMMTSEVALAVYKRFANKYLNLEHDPDTCFGHITNVALTKYSPNYEEGEGSEIIQESDIQANQPFNIAVAGYIYKHVAKNVVSALIDCNDPDNEDYLMPSLSWEVAFEDFSVMVGSETPDGSEIYEDSDSIAKYAPLLKGNRGSGETSEGKKVTRVIKFAKLMSGIPDFFSVTPMGAGAVAHPAANVRGIVTPALKAGVESEVDTTNETTAALTEINEILANEHFINTCPECKGTSTCRCSASDKTQTNDICDNCKNVQNNKNNISQSNIEDVTLDIRSPMKKITSFKDFETLPDDSAEVICVASLKNVIAEEIKRISSEYELAIKTEKDAVANAAAEADKAKEAATKLGDAVESLQEEVAEIKAANQEVESQKKFDERMGFLNDKYELNDKDREILAKKISGLSDEDFKDYIENEFGVFASAKEKAVINSTASVIETPAASETATTALENAEVVTQPTAPINSTATTQSPSEKYKNAFVLGESVRVTAGRKTKH